MRWKLYIKNRPDGKLAQCKSTHSSRWEKGQDDKQGSLNIIKPKIEIEGMEDIQEQASEYAAKNNQP